MANLSELKEGIELLKAEIWRSRGWTLALGWLVLVYGLLALVQVVLTVLLMAGLVDGFTDLGYGMLVGFGSSFLSVLCSFILIPIGIVLIRAAHDAESFVTGSDLLSLIYYQRRLRTVSILAVVILILHLLSVVVMGLSYAAALAMPSFISPG
ncbi:hypothetical protein JXM67_08025 [candidate division WOR-3 bacterium]|nr:hypothetical protein [candidate division WOR-3 bacterium]